jgi:leucyl-tRNA synthetase
MSDNIPKYRYNNVLANEIETKWQKIWQETGAFNTPNPTGDLKGDTSKEPYFIMDMFPYPSGAGLHVGHPLGYVATDIMARFKRLKGYNVLYTLGYDAFGLPAEQYAIATGQHPKITTEQNIENISKQLFRLGLSHDSRRSFATIDSEYVKWTQWIFLQLFNSYFDEDQQKARPISEYLKQHPEATVEELNSVRLAYPSETSVNWSPGLGTVVANEEVGADGKTLRGNMPVFQKPLKQWSMRITAYAQRLLDGLEDIDWPSKVKKMQQNWIGRSTGTLIDFDVALGPSKKQVLTVYTTRSDTLFGATFMVVAPEHPLLDKAPEQFREAIDEYKVAASKKTALERQTEVDNKTGVFTGLYGMNPITGKEIPIYAADYVLMGYGTGAIMAVPGGDDRDFAFAKKFDIPIIYTVAPTADEALDQDQNQNQAYTGEIPLNPEGVAASADGVVNKDQAYTGDGIVINSKNDKLDLNGLTPKEAKVKMDKFVEEQGLGKTEINYRLRDWLFSRQRYWGEPFPIVYDLENPNVPIALPESMLPIDLPEVPNFEPKTFEPDDFDSVPETPLSRNEDWEFVELDLGAGKKKYRRDTNTMPNWAGSCYYYLRYADPTDTKQLIDPSVDKYWLGANHNKTNSSGGVDLYVGGVEHAVLHLLYARFWHMALYDLGIVTSPEPFHKLFNQGYIQAYAYTDSRGGYVEASEVVEVSEPGTKDKKFEFNGEPVTQEYGKMGKSLHNVVTPDKIIEDYGADSFRIYEMSMGPLDLSKPWETRAVVGAERLCQRVWRNVIDEDSGELTVQDIEAKEQTLKILHKVIADVNHEMEAFRPNTAIARIIELNNHLTTLDIVPKSVIEDLLIMLSPVAPHITEELWSKLGHKESILKATFPVALEQYLQANTVTAIVQVNGKLRAKLEVSPDISETELQELALNDENIKSNLTGEPKKIIVKAPKVVSIVI